MPDNTYTSRDYAAIYAKMLADAPLKAPGWTNFNDGEFGVALLQLLAGSLDVLSYNLDTQAGESFIDTAVSKRAVQNILHAIGYEMRRRVAATVTVRFTMSSTSINPVMIPKGTIVGTKDGVKFVTLADAVIASNALSPHDDTVCLQGTVFEENFRIPSGLDEFSYALSNINIADNFLEVRVGNSAGVLWTEERNIEVFTSDVNTLYRAIEDFDNTVILKFSKFIGAVPASSDVVNVRYLQTDGNVGPINAATITSILSSVPTPSSLTLVVTNPNPGGGGLERESTGTAKVAGPRSLRTAGNIVSLQDYEDALFLQDNVDAVSSTNHAGFVEMYVREARKADNTYPILKLESPTIESCFAATGTGGTVPAGTIYVAATVVQTVADPLGGADLTYESNFTAINPTTGAKMLNPIAVTVPTSSSAKLELRVTYAPVNADTTRPYKFHVYAGTSPDAMRRFTTSPVLGAAVFSPAVFDVTALPGGGAALAPTRNNTGEQNPQTGQSFYLDYVDAIEPRRLLCTSFELYNPTALTVNLAMDITCRDNYRRTDVQDSVTATINTYFRSLTLGQSVYLSELEAFIFGFASGVRNAATTTPNPSTNELVTVANNQYAVPGTVVLNMIGGIA
jgi:uncharacterized phage protein gp47/JayE